MAGLSMSAPNRNEFGRGPLGSFPNLMPSVHPKAEPTLQSPEAEEFYSEAIRQLVASKIPFLLAGTYAVSAYTGISRQTKDMDVFCRPAHYPQILAHFKKLGYRIAIVDDRWIAKVLKGRVFLDVIFASAAGTIPVDDLWFEHAPRMVVFETPVRVVGPTELIWSKCFVQARDRHDGADIAHLILKADVEIDWRRLLSCMGPHWELLLAHLLHFRWVYPSERARIPDWLMDELLRRLATQRQQPPPEERVCRGRLISSADYKIDVSRWGFADVDGDGQALP